MDSTQQLNQINKLFDKLNEAINYKREEVINTLKSGNNITSIINETEKIIDSICEINNPKGQKYAEQIYGMVAQEIFIFGFIREVLQDKTNQDIAQQIFHFYFIPQSYVKKSDKKFRVLCSKIQEILGDKVQSVRIDNNINRKSCYPMRLTNHSSTESLFRAPQKITILINPDNDIWQVMRKRYKKNKYSQNECDLTMQVITNILYGALLSQNDIIADDPDTFTTRVVKLLCRGLSENSNKNKFEDEIAYQYHVYQFIKPMIQLYHVSSWAEGPCQTSPCLDPGETVLWQDLLQKIQFCSDDNHNIHEFSSVHNWKEGDEVWYENEKYHIVVILEDKMMIQNNFQNKYLTHSEYNKLSRSLHLIEF